MTAILLFLIAIFTVPFLFVFGFGILKMFQLTRFYHGKHGKKNLEIETAFRELDKTNDGFLMSIYMYEIHKKYAKKNFSSIKRIKEIGEKAWEKEYFINYIDNRIEDVHNGDYRYKPVTPLFFRNFDKLLQWGHFNDCHYPGLDYNIYNPENRKNDRLWTNNHIKKPLLTRWVPEMPEKWYKQYYNRKEYWEKEDAENMKRVQAEIDKLKK